MYKDINIVLYVMNAEHCTDIVCVLSWVYMYAVVYSNLWSKLIIQ